VDLSGFTLDTSTAQGTYVFTLGMATGGITADESISFTGIDEVGYTATLAAAAADPTASAVMLLDGAATNNYLVLTLTKDDDTTPLTTLNVTGVDVQSSSAGALTLTTAENATDAVFGGALDAVMDDTTWADIKAELKEAGITLNDSIAITFVGADGTTFDFNGANDDLTAPTITINGEGTQGAQVITGTPDGTVVGNYVTAYIPEPTSTTLSLLALAALAVRRRRK
ncbi:MAG: PEP-CTERM sorting domain-containing protein, partial [Akkermansia sp.]|nr:PEP-CTERM sorting domain-containing protein [Akkermansia sp.]